MQITRRSLQILSTRFLMDNIKQGLRREPSGHWRSNRLICELGFFITNLGRLASTSGSGSIRQKLRVAALFKTDKPEHRLFNCASTRKEAVVLKESSLRGAKGLGNILTLRFYSGPITTIIGLDDINHLLIG